LDPGCRLFLCFADQLIRFPNISSPDFKSTWFSFDLKKKREKRMRSEKIQIFSSFVIDWDPNNSFISFSFSSHTHSLSPSSFVYLPMSTWETAHSERGMWPFTLYFFPEENVRQREGRKEREVGNQRKVEPEGSVYIMISLNRKK
jgi:hypothetical protein